MDVAHAPDDQAVTVVQSQSRDICRACGVDWHGYILPVSEIVGNHPMGSSWSRLSGSLAGVVGVLTERAVGTQV